MSLPITRTSRAHLSITLTQDGLRQAAEQIVAIPNDAHVVDVEVEAEYSFSERRAAKWLSVTFEWEERA